MRDKGDEEEDRAEDTHSERWRVSDRFVLTGACMFGIDHIPINDNRCIIWSMRIWEVRINVGTLVGGHGGEDYIESTK